MSWRERPSVRATLVLAALALGACRSDAPADEPVYVAVAANFTATQNALAARFTERTGHEVVSTFGSTGQLYAQIRNGAPLHVLLAADQERPRLLEEEGLAVAGSRFSFAEGRLALYGPTLDSVRTQGADLRDRPDVRVALANPQTAPYGAAALDALARLGLLQSVRSRLARGESVAQAEQFVRSRAAELGFIALAQVIREPPSTYWLVPRELHRPLLHDAVLLEHGAQHVGARACARWWKRWWRFRSFCRPRCSASTCWSCSGPPARSAPSGNVWAETVSSSPSPDS